MDPTSIIVTAFLTALVTTLVTQGVTAAVRAAGRKRASSKEPVVLTRRGTKWLIVNQTSQVLLDMNFQVQHPEFKGVHDPTGNGIYSMDPSTSNQQQEHTYQQVPTTLSKATTELWIEIHDGDNVAVGWQSLGRVSRKVRYNNDEVTIVKGQDAYPLQAGVLNYH